MVKDKLCKTHYIQWFYYCFVGPVVTDPDTHVGYYIKHRQDREDQVMDLLKTGPQSANSIVKVSCRLWNKTII